MKLLKVIPLMAALVLSCTSSQAQIILQATGNEPIANAGPARPDTANGEPAITIPASGSVSVTLDGSGSYDPNNMPLTLSWNISPNPLATPLTGQFPTFTFTAAGVYTVTVTATNTLSLTSTSTTTITVTTSTPPVCLPTLVTPAQDKSVECDGCGNTAAFNAWLNNHGGAVATDPCETLCWSHNYTCYTKWTKGCCPVVQYVTVTFKAKDAANHYVTTSAKFKILDTTPPPLNWTVNGCTVPDYTTITTNQRSLPVTIKVNPADLCSKSTLKKSYRFLSGSGCVSYNCYSPDTVYLTSATVGAKVRIYFQATDACGNSSACEWVEIDVTGSSWCYSQERCRDGLDYDDECQRWDYSRCDYDYDFPSCGYRYCDE